MMENTPQFSFFGLLSSLPGGYLIFQTLKRFQENVDSSTTLDEWRTGRNFFYQIYVVIFIIMGVVVLFRLEPYWKKIQGTLPFVIISLILVSFSYAIAGFIFDIYSLVSP